MEKKDKNENELIADTIQSVTSLLKSWITDKSIKEIYPLNNKNTLINTNKGLEDLDNWLITPRVIEIKKVLKVEIMLAVYTKHTAYQLHKH